MMKEGWASNLSQSRGGCTLNLDSIVLSISRPRIPGFEAWWIRAFPAHGGPISPSTSTWQTRFPRSGYCRPIIRGFEGWWVQKPRLKCLVDPLSHSLGGPAMPESGGSRRPGLDAWLARFPRPRREIRSPVAIGDLVRSAAFRSQFWSLPFRGCELVPFSIVGAVGRGDASR
jgi:hypothetical protein